MQYSIIDKNETVSDFRLDAEAYLPIYLNLETTISKKSYTTFEKECSTFTKGIFDIRANCYLEKGGVPFVRISDLGDILLKEDQIVNIPEEENNKNKKTYLERGDLILSKTAYPAACFVDIDYCNVSQDTIAVKLKKDSPIRSHFLSVFLNTKYGLLQMQRWFTGNVQMHLNLSDSKKIRIPVIGNAFQNRIEKVVENAIQTKKKTQEKYGEAEQVLLSELGLLNWKPKHRLSFIKNFSDTRSADRIDAEYFQPKYEEIAKAIRSSKNHGYLSDIVSIKKCIEPGSEAYQDNGIPFLRVSNLSKFGINDDNQQFLSAQLYDTLKMHQPKEGEILLSKDATPGIAFYLKNTPRKMIPSGGILRITVKDINSIYPEYLTLVLNSIVVQKQIERDSGGSIINHWFVDQVKNTLIPILPLSVQKEISEKVDESFSNREQSKRLLDIAKRGVEIALEKNEKDAANWIKDETMKSGLKDGGL